ncbi:MAG: ABC transporter ATP-binding protein [Candidatus Lambdaproteobacteria bacterium]|nr:ABC transporter ATP-binding protein [Candidatus Lambdaproteobacteria bacterium]
MSAGRAPALEVRGLCKRYDDPEWVLDAVDLEVAAGEFLCVLGPSGCGKTTLLRLISGFERPDRGEIVYEGATISRPGWTLSPEKRRIGMVFQDVAIFPHLTVEENVRFGLRRPLHRRLARWARGLAGDDEREHLRHVRGLLELIGLTGFGQRFPHELSGGQQQRVALARALAPRPHLILLDEPFSNLDAALRQRIRDDVRSVLKRLGMTTILVTHDQEEAVNLADRVAVIHQGRLLQVGTPEEILGRPATRFVATFVGLNSFLPGEADGEFVVTELGRHALAPGQQPPGRRVDVLLRPDYLRPANAQEGVGVRVLRVDYLGVQPLYRLALPSGREVQAVLPGQLALAPGQTTRVRFSPPRLVLFPAEPAA